jgi:BirA family biotin operon repressor/biotin-[acetyl-CoA-carboxylase] ligase
MAIKDAILKTLEENRGTPLSGEALAAALRVSRTAVWKAVRQLRAEGHAIDAATNRGYALAADSSRLSVPGIALWLADAAASEKIHIFDSLESTNLTAKKMALAGNAHGAVVLAEEQTGGRGRLGRSFDAPRGDSVYISFILRPPADVRVSQLLTVAAAVAVSRTVETLTAPPAGRCQIKWVNDVLVDGKKI